MYYSVVRIINKAEYATVEVDSEEDAIQIAKELNEKCWKENPNDEYINYDYNAEEIDKEDL